MSTVRARCLVSRWACIALANFCANCSAPAEDDRSQLRVPPYEGFAPVGEALHSHCGSLDCHGDMARNLRLYGANGLRLTKSDFPGGSITTDAELRQNYVSVVALEPEMLSVVYAERGAEPDRLTLVRKGRGTEHHKGGEAMAPGGPADRCLLSWLAGNVNPDACTAAAEILRPDMPLP